MIENFNNSNSMNTLDKLSTDETVKSVFSDENDFIGDGITSRSILRGLSSEYRTDSTELGKNTSVEDEAVYRGLGVRVEKDWDVQEQLKQIGLDWEPEVSDITYGKTYRHTTSCQQVLYRPADGQFMGVVPDKWYDENQSFKSILQTFNNFCGESNLQLERVGKIEKISKVENDTHLKLKLFAIANLNSEFKLPGEDLVTGKLVLLCPYIYGQGYQVKLMSIRKVCNNGMHMPVKIAGKIIGHQRGFSSSRIEQVLNASKTGFREYQNTAEVLTRTPVSKEEATMMLIAQFGNPNLPIDEQPRQVKTCLDMFISGTFMGGDLLSSFNTAWGLLNTVTEYYNHRQVSSNPNVQIDSLWNGNRYQTQLTFYNSLSSFATNRQTQQVGF